MRSDAAPKMEALNVFRSRDVEQAREFLGAIGFDLTINGKGVGGSFDTRLNGAYFPCLWIGYTEYATGITVDTETRPDYWLQLPLRGGIDVTFGREAVACDARLGAATSPGRRRVLHTAGPAARLQVSLVAAALERQLAVLLGDWPRAPLELSPAMDLTQGYGRGLAELLRAATEEFDACGGVPWSPLVINQFEQLVMTRLLLEHPHNHSEAVRRSERPFSPRAVKRAIDYMHANLDAPITLADLVAVAGVPGRTLFEHFRAFKGVPPMRYLREQRFQQARRALLSAEAEENVTAIAMRWGFSHMGRFAIEYRRRFGESPSTTLAGTRKAVADPRYLQAMQAQSKGLLLVKT
jgi:AraC-like DNA-binding protein